MKNYDAKDASINIGGQEIYGFGDVSNFINWIPSQSFSDNPLIAINGKYAVNAKEVLCIRPTKLN